MNRAEQMENASRHVAHSHKGGAMLRPAIQLWWCLSLLACWACTSTETEVASTQVTLRIHNVDETLLSQMDALSVAFALRDGESFRAYPVKRFSLRDLRWPVDIPIAPSAGHEGRQFEVVVHALDGESVLAESRAVSAFRRGKRALLELWLYTCASGVEACLEPNCHGEQCQVCEVDGSCVAVGFTDPATLPEFDPRATPTNKPVPGWPDPAMGDGGMNDGGMNNGQDGSTDVEPDAGKDAGAEGGPDAGPDAATGPDAGVECDTEGALRCVAQASAQREVCRSGAFVPFDACAEGSLCDRFAASPGECAAVVEGCQGQTPGSVVCVGSTRLVCGPDLVSISGEAQLCRSAAYCEQGQGTECAVCIEDEHVCAGSQLRVCNPSGTGFVDKGAACPENAPCNSELRQCTPLICAANQWSCDGDKLRRCNASGTAYLAADERDCGAGLCNASAARCNVCQPNVVRCVTPWGKERMQCSSDGVSEAAISSCAGACNNGNCVACVPNSTRCDPTNPLRYRQVCNSAGAWAAGTDCFASNQTCIENAGSASCGGQCASDSTRCNTATKNPEVCTHMGQWTEMEQCSPPAECIIWEGQAMCDSLPPIDE